MAVAVGRGVTVGTAGNVGGTGVTVGGAGVAGAAQLDEITRNTIATDIDGIDVFMTHLLFAWSQGSRFTACCIIPVNCFPSRFPACLYNPDVEVPAAPVLIAGGKQGFICARLH